LTSQTSELPQYPIVSHDDLSIDAAYRALQEQGAFKARMPFGEPIWIATRYHDVKTVYGDRRFGKAVGYGRDTPRMHDMAHGSDSSRLDQMDAPNHTRVRKLASSAFAPAQIREMRSWIEDLTTRLLDDIVRQGPGADYMHLFAWRLPLQVISRILGAPEEVIPQLKTWVDTMTGVGSPLEDKMEAYASIRGYISTLIAERRETTTNDVLCILVQARDEDDRLTEQELVNLSTTLFLGGFETTAAQLGSAVWTLMAHRHLWDELLDDPDLIPGAMEELWRWIPSFRHGSPMLRWAAADVELSDGVVIPAGDPVLPEHQIANRDESVFERGWELDFQRREPAAHLSLAWGPHRCMGARLAQVELEVALRALLDRFPKLELAVAPEDVVWSSSTFLRSAEHLPISW
jgi:cytochrome P450 RapN